MLQSIKLLLTKMTFCYFFQNDTDYWLLSDAEVSITDMWRTDCIPLNVPAFCYSFNVISSFLFLVSIHIMKLISLTTTTAGVDWDGANMLHADFGITDASSPRPQTPPSGLADIPNTPVDFSRR